MKIKVVIIGCGFGGLSALRYLGHYRRELDLTVIDRGLDFSFLPGLPDIIGRDVDPAALSCPIRDLARACGASFVKAEVTQVDTALKKVVTEKGEHQYDYLVIAAGSRTTFFGNDAFAAYARTLDSVDEARQLRFLLETKGFDSFVVAGGGYTGIEIATSISRYLKRRGRAGRVLIVEKGQDILGPLPQWMKEHVRGNLQEMQVSVITNTSVGQVEGKQVRLSTGELFDNALLIWAAGVKTPAFLQGVPGERSSQGRIKVDAFLRVNSSCFIIGDCAQVFYHDTYLRMAIQFALAQGASAAANIIRSIEQRPLSPYRPVDLGFVIPLANNDSCGRILGMNMRGVLPTFLHYFMCIYRSVGWGNRFGYMRGLLRRL